MRRLATLLFAASLFFGARLAHATIFGTVRGIVHDPQHRPVDGATVKLKAQLSNWVQTGKTNPDGEFEFNAVPVGEYTVTVDQPGFEPAEQSITVKSDSAPILHIPLTLAGVRQSTTVSAQAESASTESVTPTTLVSRLDIEHTPGADRTNSMQAVTNYVPGAYFTHDQLHIRGGHQVSWLVDGVPVPNTNIASNVGPQFDPKDIDYLEVQRGSYEAEYGDRTYGVFNVVPRTGFERDNQGELITSFGNFYQTNDQVNVGGHTQRFAYYASVNGNRSDLGLQSPVDAIIHDRENGYGGFGSLLFNVNSANQLRLVTSVRRDYYQIPNTPAGQAAGIRDGEHETDGFVNFTWVRTFSPGLLLTVSPFYHYNTANYDGGANDFPVSTTDNRRSRYAGGQATFNAVIARNEAQIGFYGFQQNDHQLFGLVFNDKSNPNLRDLENVDGSLVAIFLEDKFKVARWLTLNGGVRQTHFSGSIVENATSPRVGASLEIPYLHWILHGFYGHFYQAPPLITASGPLLQFVTSQNLGFIPLRGERDEEHQFGVTIPWRGWTLDADTFRTRATNFFDHNSVGNSNIFFPLTINGALIRGWELTVHSPRLKKRGQVYLTYSNQIAEGVGAINGGLTNFSPPGGFFLLDHDQRNTLHVGGIVNLPWHSYASTDVYYGSGFSNGNPPPGHLPGHTTFDLSLGKSFGERFAISVNGLNVANRHLLIDNSSTFGGTHFNDPREIYVELRYRFHY
ncbi:MAG: TonB-dependent receptor [Candidatus Acidiferrales bacterium]